MCTTTAGTSSTRSSSCNSSIGSNIHLGRGGGASHRNVHARARAHPTHRKRDYGSQYNDNTCCENANCHPLHPLLRDEKYQKIQRQIREQQRKYITIAILLLLVGYTGIYLGGTCALNSIESYDNGVESYQRHDDLIMTSTSTTTSSSYHETNMMMSSNASQVRLRKRFLEDTRTVSSTKRKQLKLIAQNRNHHGFISWFLTLFGFSRDEGSRGNNNNNNFVYYTYDEQILEASLNELDASIRSNAHTNTFHYMNSKQPNSLFVSTDITKPNWLLEEHGSLLIGPPRSKYGPQSLYFKVSRKGRELSQSNLRLKDDNNNSNTSLSVMEWENELNSNVTDISDSNGGSNDRNTNRNSVRVDYTKLNYTYPDLPPNDFSSLVDHNYPPMKTIKELFDTWPQDQLDTPPPMKMMDVDSESKESTTSTAFRETLYHFDYNDPIQMIQALEYRARKVPFKIVNIPDLIQASKKWTDEYLIEQFDGRAEETTKKKSDDQSNHHLDTSTSPSFHYSTTKPSTSMCQESPTNFFSFYQPSIWNVENMGLPPTRENDWTFEDWSNHAKYADSAPLDHDQPHYYYQGGVRRDEHTTFISNDLPCFSTKKSTSATASVSTTAAATASPDGNGSSETFFTFSPRDSKGIQCRFGERGITAAIHYDGGRNMVGMITGAKRYVLSPPNQCSKLGIVTNRRSSIFRHSLLNFGHLQQMDHPKMSSEERKWLKRAGEAQAVETVLKAGEVLYIPSHWFHYIIGLQKNAQCNVRSGVDVEGSNLFGSQIDVTDHCLPISSSRTQ